MISRVGLMLPPLDALCLASEGPWAAVVALFIHSAMMDDSVNGQQKMQIVLIYRLHSRHIF